MKVAITNIGPIDNLSLTVPDAGIVVFQGANGAGKTTAIEAVEAALTGKGGLSVKDGSVNGKVEAFGVSLTVGRSTRRKGELEVHSLDGKLSLSELIDPGLKSPDAADAKRIKALVSLAGVLPSAELFKALLPDVGLFDSLITPTTLASPDVITLAERFKRDVESEARRAEDQAENASGRAVGCRNAAAGVEIVNIDTQTAQKNFELAIRAEQDWTSRLKAANEYQTRVSAARQALASIPPSEQLADVMENEATAKLNMEENAKAIEVLRRNIAELEAASAGLRRHYSQTIATRKNLESQRQQAEVWEQALLDTAIESPSGEELRDIQGSIEIARNQIQQAAVVERAKNQLADAESHLAECNRLRAKASQLREVAGNVDNVLSEIVGKLGTKLRVEAGRLILTTGRGKTLFDDLSAGERATIAVDIAIEVLGDSGVLTLAQEIWEGLDFPNRKKLSEHAVKRGVLILTAEATDGGIHAVVEQ